MSGKRNPAFPFYGFDFLADRDVRLCTVAQRGILVALWCEQFASGPLPDDQDTLMTLVGGGCSSADLAHVLDTFFVLNEDGKLMSERLARELQEQDDLRAKRAEAGSKGGSKSRPSKAQARKKQSRSNASDLLEQTGSEAEAPLQQNRSPNHPPNHPSFSSLPESPVPVPQGEDPPDRKGEGEGERERDLPRRGDPPSGRRRSRPRAIGEQLDGVLDGLRPGGVA